MDNVLVLPVALKPSDFAVRRAAMPAVWDWPEASPLTLSLADADGRPLELVRSSASLPSASAEKADVL